MSFSDKVSGFVLPPVLMDLFNKLHLGKAGKEVAERFKRSAQFEYVRHIRQFKLWLIKPLRIFHILSALLLIIVLALTTCMVWDWSGEKTKFFWAIIQMIPIVVHIYFTFRIPSNPIYKLDANGKPVRFPKTRTVGDKEVEHIFAGQRELAEKGKIDFSKINPILSMNVTAFVGLISSLALGMLCRDTGDRRFLALSLAVGLPSLFCFDIFIRLADWVGGKIIPVVEKTLGYVGMQLAILLPYIEEGDVSADMLDNLIREEKFLPAYLRVRNLYLEIYLLFVGALLAFPTPNTFNWVASALTFIAITSFLAAKVGLGESVLARKRKFYWFLYSVGAPVAISQMFFGTFFPEQSADIQKQVGIIWSKSAKLLNFAGDPCEHTARPWLALGIAVACGVAMKKLYPVWDKATKKPTVIIMGAGLALLLVVGFGSLAGLYINKSDSNSKICVAMVEPSKPAASSSVAPEAPPVLEVKKEEKVSEAQTLLLKQMGDQSEICLEYLRRIGIAILKNNGVTDETSREEYDEHMKKLDALTKLRESLLAFEIELKAAVNPLSPEGIAGLTDVQKQLMVDSEELAKIKVAIVDGSSTYLALPDKSKRTIANIKRHTDNAIGQVRTAPTTTPESDEAKALAEQKRLAEISAIKLAAMKAPAKAPQAQSQAESEPPPSQPAAKPSTAKQSVNCDGCTDKFAALAERLRKNKQQ